ncbi:MAG: hypothetical protein RLZZ516_941 [Cyanobacteriota bacterium]|jgi:hypothetical protein|nr:hypothetical protein [Synechococcaceae bacterium WB4_1_0192]
MATRKRAAKPAETPAQEISVDSLAAFIGDEQPDRDRLEQALTLAREAAEAFTGEAVADVAPHPIRHGVHMLAAQLLITNQLDTAPDPAAIPLVVRYFWRAADAGRQPV